MVNLQTSGTFAIIETDVYKFDQATAATYFSNAWGGSSPTVSCSGNACNGNACGVPSAPTAPLPNPDKVTNSGGSAVADKSRCTFLDGGLLTLTDTYTQNATAYASCTVCTVFNKDGTCKQTGIKSGTYTFAYTYDVAPIAETATVAPFIAWTLAQSDSSGLAHVDVNADIAGESVLVKNGTSKKYSFSMFDSYGINRVQNLALTLIATHRRCNPAQEENAT